MAIWQFDFMVIPKSNVAMDMHTDEILLWRVELLEDFRENIKEILPLKKSWSKNIILYGNVDETCIELFCEQMMLEFSVKLDLRSLSKEVFNKIIDMISEIDGQILYQEKLYPSDSEVLIQLVRESDAARFCKNPREYFDNFGNKL